MLAATASVTEKMRRQILRTLDMCGYGCQVVDLSPNKPRHWSTVDLINEKAFHLNTSTGGAESQRHLCEESF